MSIYVRDADGNRQKIAGVGLPGPAGKSAYQYAVEGGFTGTEEEFRAVVGIRNNDNLLDNWYLADPINQRGQEEYIGAGYTIDRWISSSGNNEVQIGADGVNLAIQIDGAYFAQRIRPGVLNAGDVCTFSVLTTEGLFFGTETLIADGNYHGSILIGDNFYSQYIFENGSYQFAVIKNFSNTPASITLIAAKLELGPVQTLAHKDASGNWVLNDPPPNKALELAKCQRYYLSSYINNPPGTPQTFENELVLIAIKNDRFNVNGIEFPARMRITPNVTFYAPGSGNPGYATESGSSNEVRIASVIAGPDRVNIGAPDNNLVVGHEYYLHYVADARL